MWLQSSSFTRQWALDYNSHCIEGTDQVGEKKQNAKKEEPKLCDMFDEDKTDGIKKKIPSFTKMSFS